MANRAQNRPAIPSRQWDIGQRQPLRIEKTKDARKGTPETRSRFDVFQGQLDNYKTQLVAHLNSDLADADGKVSEAVMKLAHHVDQQCLVMQDSSNSMMQDLSNETLEVDQEGTKENVILGQHMEGFREVSETNKTRLAELWQQYETVQKQIVELVVVMLNDKEILVTCPNDHDHQHNDGHEEGCPGIDKAAARRRREVFQRGYKHALEELSGFETEIEGTVSKALGNTEKAVKAVEDYQYKMKEQLRKLLTEMQQSL
ncbi:hypothetical protein LTS08_002006 [Lithohypha guttulata]|nr:hypothetical protein LTS08_002006 [Lithohypha guttulata]